MVDGLLIYVLSQFVLHPVPWKDISTRFKALIDGFWGIHNVTEDRKSLIILHPEKEGRKRRSTLGKNSSLRFISEKHLSAMDVTFHPSAPHSALCPETSLTPSVHSPQESVS